MLFDSPAFAFCPLGRITWTLLRFSVSVSISTLITTEQMALLSFSPICMPLMWSSFMLLSWLALKVTYAQPESPW